MQTLPPAMILLLRPFAPLFSKRVWVHVQVLLAGAILAPAQRTVAAALRVVGLAQMPHFQRYHRVLNRAVAGLPSPPVGYCCACSSRPSCPTGPLIIGVDETLERRTRRADCRQGRLSRRGALQPQPLRQSDRAALGLR